MNYCYVVVVLCVSMLPGDVVNSATAIKSEFTLHIFSRTANKTRENSIFFLKMWL